MLILRRHTITEAKNSVDRLHALVEQCYKEMSSRVQALEVLDMPRSGNADWMLGDDQESLATIHAHPPDLSSEDSVKSESVLFDFSDELQRSRVYRRNQAFRESVISALTNSVYSLGWSFFSDLSMAEVSNISVINLAITEGETFNPQRYSQTWSARPNDRAYTSTYMNNHRDGQRTQLNSFVRKPVPANNSATTRGPWPAETRTQQPSLPETRTVPPIRPFENRYIVPRLEEDYGKQTSAETTDDPTPTFTLPPTEPLDPSSHLHVQPTSSPQSHDPVMEDEAAYPCRGCGEVCFIQLCCFSASLLPGRSANDCNLPLDTRGRKGLRTWYVSTSTMVSF